MESSSVEELKARLSAAPFPKILERSLRASYRTLSGPRDVFVSVRADKSETRVLGEEELIYAVKGIWADHIARLTCSGREPLRESLSIFVQQVEQYEAEGRLLSSDPYASRVGMAVIEVDYQAGKEKLFFDKESGRLTKRLEIGTVKEQFSSETLASLVPWAVRIEEVLGGPQELRWGLCRGVLSFARIAPLYLSPRASVATKVWSRVSAVE
ncbi:unnamed protein product, partial [marine sediment metagenome]